jgi:hypothetical protein
MSSGQYWYISKIFGEFSRFQWFTMNIRTEFRRSRTKDTEENHLRSKVILAGPILKHFALAWQLCVQNPSTEFLLNLTSSSVELYQRYINKISDCANFNRTRNHWMNYCVNIPFRICANSGDRLTICG